MQGFGNLQALQGEHLLHPLAQTARRRFVVPLQKARQLFQFGRPLRRRRALTVTLLTPPLQSLRQPVLRWTGSQVRTGWLSAMRPRHSTHFHPMGIQSALTSDLRAAQSVERYLNGDRVALPSYASWVNKNFAEYLLIRNRFYRRELRWPRSLFWQRRQIEMPASCVLPRTAYDALLNPAS